MPLGKGKKHCSIRETLANGAIRRCRRVAGPNGKCAYHTNLELNDGKELQVRAKDGSLYKRCTATSRTGKQCGKPAVLGCSVCYIHGGKSPGVEEKARERLNKLVHPALDAIHEVFSDPQDQHISLKASSMVLDRTGFHAKTGIVEEPTSIDFSSWNEEDQKLAIEFINKMKKYEAGNGESG